MMREDGHYGLHFGGVEVNWLFMGHDHTWPRLISLPLCLPNRGIWTLYRRFIYYYPGVFYEPCFPSHFGLY